MSDPHDEPEPPEGHRPDPDSAVSGNEVDDLSPTLPAPERSPGLGSLDPRELIEAGLASRTSPLRWEPPSAEELHRLLPQYEIEAILGRGGMGAVYKGRQAALDRPVAIKLLPAEVAADPEFVARFQREARTLARLQHPGIVLVHDFGQTSEGHLYFVMEFVDGTDLYKIIHGPGLECVQALEIVAQICDALQYAHSQGVVHRDIKPANVILTQDGRTKLADFGLARPIDDGSGAFTRSNVVMGTPDYMAPEALAGEADHRADLYSLGVMLYEMLTGKPPRGAWAPPSQRVQVDVRLDEVVLRALQEDPEMRYQQASEIKTDVEVIRTTPLPKVAKGKKKAKAAPAPAAKPAEPKKERSLVGIAAVSLAVAAGFGLFLPWALKDREPKEGEPIAAAWTDALASLRLPEDVTDPAKADSFERTAEGLQLRKPDFALAALPFRIEGGYEFRTECAPKSPGGVIRIWMPGSRKGFFGIGLGKRLSIDAGGISAPIDIDTTGLSLGERQVIRVRIEPEEGDVDHVQVFVNEQSVFDRSLQPRSDYVTDRWGKVSEHRIALGGHNPGSYGQFFHTVELRALEGGIVEDLTRLASAESPPAGPIPSPEVIAARERGGRLKVFGHRSDRPIELGEASNFDDFVEVSIGNEGWAARRANGETYGQAALHLPEPKKVGPISTTHLLRGLGEPRMRMTDGSFGHLLHGEFQRAFDPAWSDTAAYLNAYGSSLVLASDGSIHDWRGGWDVPGRARPPVDFFLGASAWASPGTSFVAADRLKGVRSFEANGTLTHFPAEFRDIVEMDAGRDHVAMRSGSGDVFVSDAIGQPYEFGAKPLDLGPAVAIRAGCRMSAAQMTDGTWRAWGESSDLVSQIQKIGHAIDLDLHSDAGKVAYMMWIEPVTGAAPDPDVQSESPLLTANKNEPFVNSLGMKFVPVPGTDILMCIHETRRIDYAAYSDAVPNVDATWKNPLVEGKLLVQGEDHPVLQVSWEDATDFCAWLSKEEGRIYRLPTEREWNVAAVFGVEDPASIGDPDLLAILKVQYPWGTADEEDAANYGNYVGKDDGYEGTAPVMSYLPNRLGIFDLGGNVWEWCDGWFDEKKVSRALRGCGYLNFGGYCRSLTREGFDASYRVPVPPLDSYNRTWIPGFRCVVELDKTPAAPSIQWTRVERSVEEWAKTGQTLEEGGRVRFGTSDETAPLVSGYLGAQAQSRRFAVRAKAVFHDLESSFEISNRTGPGDQVRGVTFSPFSMAFRNGALGGPTKVVHPDSAEAGVACQVEVLFDEATVYARFDGQTVVIGDLSPALLTLGTTQIRGGAKAVSLSDLEFAVLDPIDDPLKTLGWELESARYSVPWTRVERNAEDWAKTGQTLQPDGWVRSDDKGFIVFDRTHVTGHPKTSHFAVRARVRFHEPESNLSIRNHNDRGSTWRGVQIWPNKLSFTNETREPSQMRSHAEKVAVDEEAYVEILYSGDKAHTRFNGQPVVTGDVSPAIPWQKCHLNAGLSCSVRDLEYAILDGMPDPWKALGWKIRETGLQSTEVHWQQAILDEEQTSALTSDGWFNIGGDERARFSPLTDGTKPVTIANGAVAVSLRRTNPTSCEITHWIRIDSGKGESVRFQISETELIAKRQSGEDEVILGRCTFESPFAFGNEERFEMVAIGDAYVARFKGEELRIADPDGLSSGAVLFIGHNYQLKDFEYASLDDIPDPLKALGWEEPVEASTAGAVLWQKAGWDKKDLPMLAKNGWMTVPRQLQAVVPFVSGTRSQVKFKDGALRAKFRNDGADQISLYFHALESGAPIALQLFENELVAKIAPAGKREEHVELGRITFDSPFRQGDAELIEAAVVGQTYVVRFKGHELRFEVSEPTTEGIANFHGRDFAVRDVEYVILDGVDDPWKVLGWEVPEDTADGSAVGLSTWKKTVWANSNLADVSADGWFSVGDELGWFEPRQSADKPVKFQDGAIRAQVRFDTPLKFWSAVGFWLRQPMNQSVSFGITESELVAKRNVDSSESVELGRIVFDTPFLPGEVEPFEAAVVGETFIARFKGKELRFEDPLAIKRSGPITIHGRNYAVKDVEYAILDGIEEPWEALEWTHENDEKEIPWQTVPIPEGKPISADGWWTYTHGDGFFNKPAHRDLRFQNGGVRFEFRPPADGSPNLQIRQSSPSPGLFCFLSAVGNIRLTYRDEEWRHTFSDWNSGQPNTIELAAVGKAVRIRMNDEVFQATLPELTPAGVFGFGIQKDRAGIELRNLEYLNLDGHTEAEARQLLGWDIESVETDSAEPWHDFLAELADGPHKNVQLGRVFIPENGNWRVVRYHIFTIPDEAGRDLAVRISGVMAPGKGPAGTPGNFAVHCRQKGDGDGYTGRLYNTGNAYLQRGAEDLKRFDLGPDFDPTASHTLELRAVGNRLTLLVDGIEQGSVIDATLSAGGSFGMGASEGGLIEKAEYQWLSDPPAAVEPIVWQNFLAELENGPHRNQQLGQVWEREGAAWRIKHYHVFMIPDEAGRDLAIRATGSGSLGVFARDNGEAGYAGRLYDSVGRARIQLNEEILREYRIPRDEDGSKMSTIELRAVGDTLTLLVDDVELGSVQDEALAAGGLFGVTAGEGSLVEKVEYRFLGEPSAKEAAQSPALTQREIAERLLGLKAELRIRQPGKQTSLRFGDALPEGDFDLIDIVFPMTAKATAETYALVAGAPNLEKLTVNGNVTTLAPVAGLTKLKNLSIATGGNNRDEESPLSEEEMRHLEQLTELESLFLGNMAFTGRGCRHLARATKLESLFLGQKGEHIRPIDEAGAAAIAELTSLTKLSLRGEVFDPADPAAFPIIAAMPNLALLDLGETTITRDMLAEIAKMPKLQSLHLGICELESQEFSLLAPLADRLTELTFNYDSNLNDSGVKEIADTLVNLRQFNLGWKNACTGAALRELARLPKLHDFRYQKRDGLIRPEDFEALTQFPVLNQLSMVSCGLTDEFLKPLGRCPNLAAVTVTGNSEITDAGLAHLHSSNTIRYVEVAGTQVTDAGIAALKAALPGCNVKR